MSDKAMPRVCYVTLGMWLTIAACFERCVDIAFSGELKNLTQEQTTKFAHSLYTTLQLQIYEFESCPLGQAQISYFTV